MTRILTNFWCRFQPPIIKSRVAHSSLGQPRSRQSRLFLFAPRWLAVAPGRLPWRSTSCNLWPSVKRNASLRVNSPKSRIHALSVWATEGLGLFGLRRSNTRIESSQKMILMLSNWDMLFPSFQLRTLCCMSVLSLFVLVGRCLCIQPHELESSVVLRKKIDRDPLSCTWSTTLS